MRKNKPASSTALHFLHYFTYTIISQRFDSTFLSKTGFVKKLRILFSTQYVKASCTGSILSLAISLFMFDDVLSQNDKSTQIKLIIGKNELIKYSNPSLPIVEPHIAVNPKNNDHMVIAAMVYDSASSSDSRTHFVSFTTKDNGKSWKQTELDMKVAFDPWVAVRDDQNVLLAGLVGFENNSRNFLGYYTSGDGGLSWSKDVVKLEGVGHDHPTLVIDHDRNDRLYLLSIVLKRNEAKQAINYVYLNYSDDWKKFQDSAALFATGTNNINSLTVSVHHGTVVLPYIEYSMVNNAPTTPSIKVLHADSGRNFSGPFLITEKTGVRKGFPVLAIDNVSSYKGRRYFVKNSGSDPARSNGLFLQYSEDGRSWSEDIRIDHNEAKEKFIRTAAIAINKNGMIGIAWVDRRNDNELKKNDIYFTVSTDGGKTFQPEQRVTPVNSDPLTAANAKAAERHISGGDYMGCIAKPDGSFQLVWADNRSGVFQLYTSNIQLK